ncbi:TNF-alpha receptor-like protein [Orthopoxvirus akhmetapox]|uniref:TNF-alpha receptor-like protein n=1 Tax=Orthopoxvirus akhmetapox TaxID=2200830 RepID=A0A5J6CRF0_9POXV|nr:TNF-alpha receptor-like protein [Akhmeta virus]QEQ49774.1 TNF-alpha receptor-like protein [Akhmeta virus]
MNIIFLSAIVSCLVYTTFGGKTCPADYYLNPENGLCTACVTCLSNMVEIQPCGPDKPRKCECGSGFKCTLPAVNSCARCTPDTTTKKVQKEQKEQCCNTPDNTKLCYHKYSS